MCSEAVPAFVGLALMRYLTYFPAQCGDETVKLPSLSCDFRTDSVKARGHQTSSVPELMVISCPRYRKSTS